MRWITSTMFANLLDRLMSRERDAKRVARRVDEIRGAMLGLLGDEGMQRYPQVARRIQFSGDEMALWYARGELMAALADLYGEEAAHQRVKGQTALFKGLVPKSMVARSAVGRP